MGECIAPTTHIETIPIDIAHYGGLARRGGVADCLRTFGESSLRSATKRTESCLTHLWIGALSSPLVVLASFLGLAVTSQEVCQSKMRFAVRIVLFDRGTEFLFGLRVQASSYQRVSEV